MEDNKITTRYIVYKAQDCNGFCTSWIELKDLDVGNLFSCIYGIYKSEILAYKMVNLCGKEFEVKEIYWEE